MNRFQRFTYNSLQHVLWPLALAAFVVLCVLMSGCSPLTQQTRTEAIAQQQASTGASQSGVDIVSKVTETPKPAPTVGTVTVSGENNKVEVTPPPPAPVETQDTRETRVNADTKQKGGTSDKYSHVGEDSSSLTIIGWAVGLGLLAAVVFGIVWVVRRYSLAADAAWNELDRSLAEKIQRARTRAATTTDPLEMAKTNAEIAELERERGIAASE